MTETSDRAHKYFSIVFATLIVMAVVIASIIYSFFIRTPDDLTPLETGENGNGVPYVNPVGGEVPDSPPYVPVPTTPPPS